MADTSSPRSSLGDSLTQSGAEARHRELATEHMLFQTLVYIERQFPGLFDHLEQSIDRLGDHASDETKDDDAVKEIARLFVQSLRRTAG
ncbi:hypothetical protein [Rubellimicrobium arenae]|uniref:hypothetical protein n=1 Tax=Rubellimicrobium arenae TaxID=2817372 RepID=UPI001B310126|nr:hypothetical protein [Rubellimicrobium arenae]